MNWTEDITGKIYDLGKLIVEKSPNLLDILKAEISISNENEKEILYFIESEINVNMWGYIDPQCYNYIITLTNKYPNNPEFLQDLGNIELAKHDYLLSINYGQRALKLNPKNSLLLIGCFIKETDYIENLISEEKFTEAQNYLNECIKKGTYDIDIMYNNWLMSIGSRINDHLLIRKVLNEKERTIENVMDKKFERERFKAIELIGVFTAIVAFIFATISFSTKFSLKETLPLEIIFGLILILFVVALSLIFQPKDKEPFKDIRFYSLIVIMIALIITYLKNS